MLVAVAGAAAADPYEDATAAYERGDNTTALRLFRSLADQGNANAQAFLGLMYESGDGVPQNHIEAVKWYRKAALQGHTYAQRDLAFIYYNGAEGVPQNYAEAARWFRDAAEHGYGTAQSILGDMYNKGQGVPQNYGEAVKWYRKAADQGSRVAQHKLGIMYESGQGVQQS
jgi:TPR repeat protein